MTETKNLPTEVLLLRLRKVPVVTSPSEEAPAPRGRLPRHYEGLGD